MSRKNSQCRNYFICPTLTELLLLLNLKIYVSIYSKGEGLQFM